MAITQSQQVIVRKGVHFSSLSFWAFVFAFATFAAAQNYHVGVGKSKITDGAHRLILQGFADPSQASTGVHDELYARAYVIKDPITTKIATIAVMDNWSATDKIKRTVISRVARSDLTEENFLLTATHAHSAAGGYSDWKLYETAPGGYDKHNFECIVQGVVNAINAAFNTLAPGNIYVNSGNVANAPGGQRSVAAYNANPSSERAQYTDNIDKDMLLIKLTKGISGNEQTVGTINWHSIHPTSLGQDYKFVSADSKGYAEYLLEQEFANTVVAAFANSNAGDVSANVANGRPTGKSKADLEALMQADGRLQYEAALLLLDAATSPLTGGVDYRYKRVNMGNTAIEAVPSKRTWPGGLGLSFAAGSREDGVARIKFGGTTFDSFNLREGITVNNITAGELVTEATIISAMALEFGIVTDNADFVDGHLPKPLILRTGIFSPTLTPNVVPLQIIKLGQLAIVAVPGEPTTMAGRRIKQTVLNELSDVAYVAVTGYSNEYASYITTKEEYDQQHYEGASTLFGPYTLMAYEQEYKKLAQALSSGNSVPVGASKDTPSVPNMYRVTIRNTCNGSVDVQFYNDGDWFMGVTLDGIHTIPPDTDYAYIVTTTQTKRMRIKSSGKVVRGILDGDLVTLWDCGNGVRGGYTPYHNATF